MIKGNQTILYDQVSNNQWKQEKAEIIVESPLSLTINGEVWLSIMCTPTDLEAMAVGFLFNERVIQKVDELVSVRLCPTGDNVDVWLTHKAKKPETWRRTTGCTGGVTSVEEENITSKPLSNGLILDPRQIQQLVVKLFEAQELYRVSGGVHTSALSDGEKIILTAEDIGRHNTLDKIAGRLLLEAVQLQHRVILTTGRISSEMLQKSARLGATIVISRTSPSSMSILSAKKSGITLIGYARRSGFRIYTHAERVRQPESVEFYSKTLDKTLKKDGNS